jgi:hypothetical protein
VRKDNKVSLVFPPTAEKWFSSSRTMPGRARCTDLAREPRCFSLREAESED